MSTTHPDYHPATRESSRYSATRNRIADGGPSRGLLPAALALGPCRGQLDLPIVEPEVLMQGDHSLARCSEVTEEVLQTLFAQLYRHRVLLERIVLKPNMVLPGLDHPRQPAVDEVASATVECLLRSVPAAVPAIAFLSGGQSSELATHRLNDMHARFGSPRPWALSFSFARVAAAGFGDMARRQRL